VADTSLTMKSACAPSRIGLKSPWSVKGCRSSGRPDKRQYFTDQGDLSPILGRRQADFMVSDVFSHWTTIPGAEITATQAGHLAEDVSRRQRRGISRRHLLDYGGRPA